MEILLVSRMGIPPNYKDGDPPTPQVKISKTQGWRPPNLKDGEPPKPKYRDPPNPQDVDPQNPRTLITLRMEIPQTPRIEIPQPKNGDLPRREIPSSHEDEDPPKTQGWRPPPLPQSQGGRSPPGSSLAASLTPHCTGQDLGASPWSGDGHPPKLQPQMSHYPVPSGSKQSSGDRGASLRWPPSGG